MTDRKKPGIASWATVVVVAVLVGYPLSFGPACRLAGQWPEVARPLAIVYWPPMKLLRDKPIPIATPLLAWWVDVCRGRLGCLYIGSAGYGFL
jgi:hypothetical protein